MLNTHLQDDNNASHAATTTITSSTQSELKSETDQQHRNALSRSTSLTERTRLMIVCIAALLAVLSFVAFIITGDMRTLLGTSVLAYPFFKVVDFYFSTTEMRHK